MALVVTFTLAFGCKGRFSAEDPPLFVPGTPDIGDVGVDVSSQVVVEHPLFGGITSMLAGDGVVEIAWEAATDDIDDDADLTYNVYLSTVADDQDFSSPTSVTAPGATQATVAGLVNGRAVYCVVRAVDLDGNEDPNVGEWFAVPNPVRYVSAASPAGLDGLTPQTAYNSINQAIVAAIPAGGVNIYVSQGGYSENLFLFPGMSLYGGFSSDFGARDPATHVTEIFTPFSVDLIHIPPGLLPVVADGVVLSGNQTAVSGISAEDIDLRLTNLEIRDVLNQGIELFSHADNGLWIRGLISRCTITRSGGEGILLAGTPRLTIDNNRIRDSANEGIESQWVFAQAGERAELTITRNRIEGSGDEGIDLDFAEISELDPSLSATGRVRVLIRNNAIVRSALGGIMIDVDFENGDDIDLRVRIDDNRIQDNRGDGLILDGDAGAYFRVARNVISANRGHGVRLSGTSEGPWIRVTHNRILGNGLDGVIVDDLAGVEIRHSILRGNGGRAITAPRAYVDVVNSMILDHPAGFDATRVRHTILRGNLSPVSGPGNLFGDPALENHPDALSFVPVDGSGSQVPVANPSEWSVGDVLEIADEGIARSVLEVRAGAVVVEPAPLSPATTGQLVGRFAPAQSVLEREGLLVGSPSIDAGDPLEIDRNGTVADLGPVGGATPGNVGVETALGPDERLELVRAIPVPGFLTTNGVWTCFFNRDLPPDAGSGVRVLVNGVARNRRTIVAGNRMTVRLAGVGSTSPPAFLPSDRITLEFLPASNPTSEQFQEHLLLDFTGAASFVDADTAGTETNGTPASAQILTQVPALGVGAIDVAGDSDYYRFTLIANQTLRVELIAGRDESPVIGRATVLAADGVTVLATATAAPPDTVDPVVPVYTANGAEDVIVRIENATGSGGILHTYRLAIFVE